MHEIAQNCRENEFYIQYVSVAIPYIDHRTKQQTGTQSFHHSCIENPSIQLGFLPCCPTMKPQLRFSHLGSYFGNIQQLSPIRWNTEKWCFQVLPIMNYPLITSCGTDSSTSVSKRSRNFFVFAPLQRCFKSWPL